MFLTRNYDCFVLSMKTCAGLKTFFSVSTYYSHSILTASIEADFEIRVSSRHSIVLHILPKAVQTHYLRHKKFEKTANK